MNEIFLFYLLIKIWSWVYYIFMCFLFPTVTRRLINLLWILPLMFIFHVHYVEVRLTIFNFCRTYIVNRRIEGGNHINKLYHVYLNINMAWWLLFIVKLISQTSLNSLSWITTESHSFKFIKTAWIYVLNKKLIIYWQKIRETSDLRIISKISSKVQTHSQIGFDIKILRNWKIATNLK